MKNIDISKKIRSDVYLAYEHYQFRITWNGKYTAEHYIDNKRGTYKKVLSPVFFESAEEGNKFYKHLIQEGYSKGHIGLIYTGEEY